MFGLREIFTPKKLRSKDLALISLFIAIQIILTRFCSIQTPIVRIDLNFLAVSMCAAIFGPLWGGIAAAIADIIGVTLFPAGAFFPGFTLTAFLMGVVYGMFLHNRQKSYLNIIFPVLIVTIGLSLYLDTIWVTMLTGKGFIALMPVRLAKAAVMIPLQIILIHFVWNTLGSRVSLMMSDNS